MSIATSTALGIGAAVSAGTGLASGIMGASAAKNAANKQSSTALQVAQLQHGDNEAALDLQKQQLDDSLKLGSPYATAGAGAVTNLASLLGVLSPDQLKSPAPPSAADLVQEHQSSPANFEGKGFDELTNSRNPQISPDQVTTHQWKAQGIPFHNITTTDGRTVAVRDMPAGAAAPAGAQPGVGHTAGAPGTVPLSSLINPSLGAPGSLSQGFNKTFTAPTDVTEQNDPGYKFRLDQGRQAIDRSAAARGSLLSGGTLKDLTDYEQGAASNEYNNVYNRSLGEFQQSYNMFNQAQADKYNRIANLAGLGQVEASQLSAEGQNATSNAGNILLTGGAQQGQALNNAAAATASGYVGAANAYGGALNNVGNQASQYVLLNSLLSKPGSGAQAFESAHQG